MATVSQDQAKACVGCFETSCSLYLLPCLHTLCESCLDDVEQLKVPASCPACRESLHSEVGLYTLCVKQTTMAVCPVCHVQDEGFGYFCNSCRTFLCERCMQNVQAKEHQGHEWLSLDDCGRNLVRLTESAHQRLRQLQEAQFNLQHFLQEIRDQVSALAFDIAASFGKVTHPRQLIDARCAELQALAQVEAEADMKITALQIENVRIVEEALLIACQQAEAVVSSSRLRSHSLGNYDYIDKRLSNFVSCQIETRPVVSHSLQYSSPNLPLSTPIERFGRLYRGRNYKRIRLPQTVLGSRGSGEGSLYYPVGIATTPDGQMVVAEYGNLRLQWLDAEGQSIRVINLPFRPNQIAVSSSQIWITESQIGQLLCYGYDGVLVRSHECVNPYGICLLSDGSVIASIDSGRMVTAINSSGTTRWVFDLPGMAARGLTLVGNEVFFCDSINERVVVISALDGHFLRTIGTNLLSRPRSVAATSDGHVVVTEADSHCVSIWSLDGEFVHRFGEKGEQQGQFARPCACAVLPDLRLAIVDYENHRVQLF